MQYRFGTFTTTGTATALTLPLGFIPSKFVLTNYTGYNTDAVVNQSIYYNGMLPGYALTQTAITDSDLVSKYQSPGILTSNGFTAYSDGADWVNQQTVITGISKANPAVVTSTNTYSNGDTITISNVKGMIQVNEQRYIVTSVSGSGYSLYDLFGNPVNSLGFGIYVDVPSNPATADRISTPAIGAVVDATTGRITTPGQPPGNQYDIGFQGITMGTSLFRANADVFYWEAFYMSPTGW